MATITDYHIVRPNMRRFLAFLLKPRVVKHSSNGLETSYINNLLLT